ncbi:hypothetical protein [Legionella maceachernii]|nr:hypothetical protein [Legionella maceachernii]
MSIQNPLIPTVKPRDIENGEKIKNRSLNCTQQIRTLLHRHKAM